MDKAHFFGLDLVGQYLDDFLEKFEYLAQTVDAVDRAALIKYQLASFD